MTKFCGAARGAAPKKIIWRCEAAAADGPQEVTGRRDMAGQRVRGNLQRRQRTRDGVRLRAGGRGAGRKPARRPFRAGARRARRRLAGVGGAAQGTGRRGRLSRDPRAAEAGASPDRALPEFCGVAARLRRPRDGTLKRKSY